MSKILDNLQLVYPPRYGPEWGSGGIFGLKYHKGVIYFTLAFEAEAHFIKEDYEKIYKYELTGPGPRSGGDTYNSIETVDEHIYFGGWVHAPAIYMSKKEGKMAEISFKNKYSHVHVYNIYNDKIELLWIEGLNNEVEWVGEISEIIYDPINDRLLLARGDGMVNLGVYQIDRKGKNYLRLSEIPAQKGSYFYDHICFDMFKNWVEGVSGIQCIDLVENKTRYLYLNDIGKRSVDGDETRWKLPGSAISAYGRFFLFVRGGILVGNPVDEFIESITFYRLFDFGLSAFSPRRGMAKAFAGGILSVFNSYSEAIIYPTNDYEKTIAEASNTIVSPSLLLYITPPVVKIIAAFGARITGFEFISNKILIASNTMANTFRYDALPIDAGFRSFTILDQNIINSSPPPLTILVKGSQIKNKTFGGIPLTGYKEPKLKIYSKKNNILHIYEYNLMLPPTHAIDNTYNISKGVNIIELDGYRNSIISFKFDEEDEGTLIKIELS